VDDHNAVEVHNRVVVVVAVRTADVDVDVDVAVGGSPEADIRAAGPAGDIAAAGTAAVEDRVRCDTWFSYDAINARPLPIY